MMEVYQIIDFLETDNISVTFSPNGLKYLSLNTKQGAQCIDLRLVGKKLVLSPVEKLVLEETSNFLETGKHAMPLDLSDFSDFQQSVFVAVSRVEPGEVTTYKGIAEMLGKPGAAQAVGNAIVKNPVSYFLPTHRVIPQKGMVICRRAAGRLKEKLLAHEGHDLTKLRGNTVCTRKICNME